MYIIMFTFHIQIINKPPNSFSQTEYWIGLSGLYDHFDNSFVRWSDNSQMTFQNFDYNNLMNLTGTENCTAINIISGN